MAPEIRRARAADSDAIADLHVLSWRDSYRGVLPDAYLDGDAVAERRAAWARFFAASPPRAVPFVAPGAGRPLDGFVALERGHEPGYGAFKENLHVAPAARGRGLGKRLMAAAAVHLIETGVDSLCLRVYDANTAAIAFYLSLGGIIDGHGIDLFAGADAPDTRIGWHDLEALRKRCG